MNKKNVLSVRNLSKIYKRKKNSINALNNLNLEVKEGEIFGLLGPNGAGKSTFINILGGTVVKTSGKVDVWNFDLDINPRQVRASVGIVPQEVNLDPFFSPRKSLEFQAGLYGVKKDDRITDDILKLVSLESHADSYARSLSGGMKRRLWENVKLLNTQGVTIILTTHYLEEAEKMCDRIGILNKGNLVALDSTVNLLGRIQTKKVTFKVNKKVEINDKALKSLKILYNRENEICLSYEKSKTNIQKIIDFIKKKNVEINDISTDDGDLEDVFLRLIKN